MTDPITDKTLAQRILGHPENYPPEFKAAIPNILRVDPLWKVLLKQLPDLGDLITAEVNPLISSAIATEDASIRAWVNSQNFATQAYVGSQGFATQLFVTSQGYLTSSAAAATYETKAHATATYDTLANASSLSSRITSLESRVSVLEALNVSYASDSGSRTCADRSGSWVEPTQTLRINGLAAGSYLILFGGICEITANAAAALGFAFGVGIGASDPTADAQTWAGVSSLLSGDPNDYVVESFSGAVTATLGSGTNLSHKYRQQSSNGGTVAMSQRNRWIAAVPYS